MKYGVLILAVVLVACNSATGNVVEDTTNVFEEQVAALETALADKESLLAAKDALVDDAKVVIADLEAQVAAKQTLVNQQKVILREMDDERLEALAEAERCDELEQNNEKLQKMLDICQEDLS